MLKTRGAFEETRIGQFPKALPIGRGLEGKCLPFWLQITGSLEENHVFRKQIALLLPGEEARKDFVRLQMAPSAQLS